MKFLIILLLGIINLSAIAQTKEYYLLVGTYTKPKGNGEGIYVYRFNATTGTATLVSKIASDNPSYLAISKNEKFVYAVNENIDQQISTAAAFTFNKKEGTLSLINKESVQGKNPCYITVDKQNKWLFTANYTSGNISCLPINKDGSIAPLQQFIQHNGSSIVKSRQTEAHAHTVVFSPDEKFIAATDLGTDKISLYAFNSNNPTTPLTIDSANDIISKSGNGPRHLAFNQKTRTFYAINELSGTIDVFENKSGMKLIQNISTDTTNNTDKSSGDIHLSNDGKFLYATNRGKYNTIAIYKVDAVSGNLTYIGLQSTLGKTPRNFMIDPTDNFLLVAHQNSDNIFVFKRNKKTGLLTYTNIEIKLGSPVCLKMISTN
jgi:6-phosphogluconolactonase